jgi:hypothetical protein
MDPDSGSPKACGSCGSGSPTLSKSLSFLPTVQGRETALKEPKVFQNIYLEITLPVPVRYMIIIMARDFFNEKAGNVP